MNFFYLGDFSRRDPNDNNSTYKEQSCFVSETHEKKNEMNNTQMGKSAEIVEIHTFSASARSQNQ
jgi:hypothetical protein